MAQPSRSGTGRVPLAVTWIAHDVRDLRAGTARDATVTFENAGAATWRSRGDEGVRLSYHWSDHLGNPILWDCPRGSLPRDVKPGDAVSVGVRVRAPMPPGRYVLGFDLVDEHRFWFSDVGVPMLTTTVVVEPRITARRLGVHVHPGPGDEEETRQALAAQEEAIVEDEPVAVAHLVAGCLPARDWSRRLLDAHSEGYGAVGGSIMPPSRLWERRAWRHLAPWAPGGGRNPRFPGSLLLPSLVDGLEPAFEDGWPVFPVQRGVAWDETEPALFDGRIEVRLRPRSGRRPT